MFGRWVLPVVCGFLVCLAASQPTTPATNPVRFGGPPNNVLVSGIQVNREFSESVQLSPERFQQGWFKRAGGDLTIPNTHMLVYLHSESCRRYVSFFNRTCLEKDERKALFFPRVDHLTRLEINNSMLIVFPLLSASLGLENDAFAYE